MYNYKITLAYDGTSYNGWQIQPNAPSIQETLQDCLKILLRQPQIQIIGSGRTDAGVHALGQVAHFKSEQGLDLHKTLYSLNGLLPQDIRIQKIEIAPHDFHAQHSAKGKEYHYFLYLDRVMNPFSRLYCWHLHYKIDHDLLLKAAKLFVGTHDFTSFANESESGVAAYDAIRTLFRLDIIETPGGLRLEFEGDGFLYKMVRNIVGTLIEVAVGKRSIDEIQEIFEAKDRKKAGQAAPPQGLFLIRVKY